VSQVSILIVIMIGMIAQSTAFADEDPEGPLPVTTVTKRTSIHSRHLPALVELTETHSPIIQKAKNDLEQAKLEMENVKWGLFPQLNLEQRFGIMGADPKSRETPVRTETNLSLRQVLFDDADWAPNFTRLKLVKQRYERMKLEYEYKRDEQFLAVANAYLDWSSVLGLREIDENKRDLLRRQFNVLEAQYKQGLKTKRDVLRIETEIKKLEIDILARDNEVDLDFQKLASAIGLTKKELDEQDIEGEEAKPFGVMKSNETEIKIEDHRKTKIFKYLEKEASYDSKLIEWRYWPQIALENEIKYYNQDYVDSTKRFDQNEVISWQSLIVLRYSFWDFGVRRRNWEIQKVKENSVHADNQKQLFELAIVLRETFLKLRQFRETVKTTRELLVLEQQSYSILEAEYRNGRAAYLDLITNLNSLIDARSKFMTSYFGFKKQQMLYAFHKGDLYEEIKQK
jgi:outer membrane protein TolC